jgi:Cellulase (glycosyl hydrolase family 5)
VRVLQDDAVFLHRSDAETAAAMDQLRDLNVDWLRITAGWGVIETERGRYPEANWAPLDRAVRLAAERELKVNIDIAFWAPEWAVARRLGIEGRERWAPDPEQYARFAAAVAARYPQAAAFTVWNEPNHNVFLMPQWERRGERWRPASPRVYRDMLRASVPAIRAAAPDALVLIGALSSIGTAHGRAENDRMAPLLFLRELACVDERYRPLRTRGCRDFERLPGDGFSHHPYSTTLPPWEPDPAPDNVRMADLGRLVAALGKLRDRFEGELPIYLTEFGYQTNPPDPTWEHTPADQARYLEAAEGIARSIPQVRSSAQFLLRDLPRRDGPTAADQWRDYQSGLLYEDGRPKPAAAVYKRLGEPG